MKYDILALAMEVVFASLSTFATALLVYEVCVLILQYEAVGAIRTLNWQLDSLMPGGYWFSLDEKGRCGRTSGMATSDHSHGRTVSISVRFGDISIIAPAN